MDLYKPLCPDTLANPFPIFRRLQQEAPVFWHDGLYAWVLSRYRDCRQVLRHPERFTRDRRKLGRPVPAAGMTIQSLDPPDQIALRQAVLHALQRADIAAAGREACEELERCLSSKPGGRPFDFMSEAAAPTAMRFACRLVGVPELSAEAYLSIFLRLSRAMDSALDPRRGEAGVEATQELNAIIDEAKAAAAPGSMLHELYAVPGVAEMPFAYVRNTISAIFNAAYSTAHSSMGSFLLLALERPGLARRVVDTGNVAVGVRELLRFTSPAQSTGRYATRDTVIGGMEIRQNDPIVTLMAAANRDPEVFDRPDELVLDRTPNPHLGFGSGPHRCVGAIPAEEILSRFVQCLARWESELALAGAPTWLDTATLRCIDRLPTARRDGQGDRHAIADRQ
ncbi:MAG: cytochrome P450 [Polyangia bacterium]